MTNRTRFLALLAAVSVNAAALATANEAMTQFTKREQLSGTGTGRTVVRAAPANTVLAKRNCPPAVVL
jgi:hypothetical protein